MHKYGKRIDKNIVALISGLAIIAAIGIAAVVWIVSINPLKDVDVATFCRTKGDRSVTLVLVDATDPLTVAQDQRLKAQLMLLRDGLPRFDRIVLYAIDSTKPDGVGKPLVDACNPGKASDIDELRETARIVQDKYNKLFDTPFQKALKQIMAAQTQDRSPILEAIDAATNRTFGSLKPDPRLSKRIIIISDMLQNTNDLTFYSGQVPQFPEFNSSDAFRLHRPSLSGVSLVVWEINRPTRSIAERSIRRSEIARFWSNYFKAEGAVLSATYWDATKI